MKECFVVTMYKFGKRNNHSYVLGVYNSAEKAKHAAKEEVALRGGEKYLPEIITTMINQSNTGDIILRLKEEQDER